MRTPLNPVSFFLKALFASFLVSLIFETLFFFSTFKLIVLLGCLLAVVLQKKTVAPLFLSFLDGITRGLQSYSLREAVLIGMVALASSVYVYSRLMAYGFPSALFASGLTFLLIVLLPGILSEKPN